MSAYIGEIYSTVCALLWAVAVILFRRSGEQVSPVALNLFKGVFALLIFVPLLPLMGVDFLPASASGRDWLILAISGAFGIGLADTLFFRALNRIGAGGMAIVDCLYSPFVVLCSFLYLGNEPLGPCLFVAMGLMVAAILVGTWSPERAVDPVQARNMRIGVLLGITAQLIMAAGIVLAKPVLDQHDGWWVTTVRLSAGVLFLLVQASFPRHRAAVAYAFRPGPAWRVLLPASFIGAFLAMILWILGMKYTHTTIAGVLNQTNVIFILLLAWLFLKEPLTPRRVAAIVLGFAASVIVLL